jgi:hypothetical protein
VFLFGWYRQKNDPFIEIQLLKLNQQLPGYCASFAEEKQAEEAPQIIGWKMVDNVRALHQYWRRRQPENHSDTEVGVHPPGAAGDDPADYSPRGEVGS